MAFSLLQETAFGAAMSTSKLSEFPGEPVPLKSNLRRFVHMRSLPPVRRFAASTGERSGVDHDTVWVWIGERYSILCCVQHGSL